MNSHKGCPHVLSLFAGLNALLYVVSIDELKWITTPHKGGNSSHPEEYFLQPDIEFSTWDPREGAQPVPFSVCSTPVWAGISCG
jgi:hypothetical protein